MDPNHIGGQDVSLSALGTSRLSQESETRSKCCHRTYRENIKIQVMIILVKATHVKPDNEA